MSSQGAAGRDAFSPAYRCWVLAVLFLIYMLNYVDRALLNIVGQAVKQDLGLSDFQLGLASGTAFAFINGLASIPIARLAERMSRVTIITAALGFWSVMTALCGAAQNFTHLLLARAGVGIGEAGGIAPSQSLIVDYYPPEKRATALAIFGTATPIGMLVGALGSGWVTDQLGWRIAFVVIGLPGVLVAVAAAFTLRELPRGHSDGVVTQGEPPAFTVTLAHLWRRSAYVQLVIGCTLLNFAFFGFLTFLHPFLVRDMGLGYGEAATFYGLITGISCGIGYLASGFVADRLGRADRRWYLWVPAIGALVAGPAFAIGLLQTDLRIAALCFTIGGIGACSWYGPSSAVMHSVAEPRMRATAVAICALIVLAFGIALGPAVVGLLSDRLGTGQGLRWALVLVSPFYFWAALHYAFGAGALRAPASEPPSGAALPAE